MLCTVWKVERMGLLNVLQFQGQAMVKENSQRVLLSKSVEIIKKAKRFRGIPIQPRNIPKIKKNYILVTFSLIFPSEKEMKSFIKVIPNV